MIIVKFRWRHHWKVVARMIVECDNVNNGQPNSDDRPVASHDQWTQKDGHQIGEEMFEWVTVDGRNGDWRLPVMMDFVHLSVQFAMVQQSMKVVEWRFLHQCIDQQVDDDFWYRRHQWTRVHATCFKQEMITDRCGQLNCQLIQQWYFCRSKYFRPRDLYNLNEKC